MAERREFENAITDVRDYIAEFSNYEKLINAKQAVRKLRTLYQRKKEENEYLKRLFDGEKFKGSVSMSEEAIDSQPPVAEPQTKEECNIKLKVKFLLKKCKDLYDLIQEHDTPTEELVKRVNAVKAKISKAFRPYQDTARKLFEEGLIEDISHVFIKLTEKPSCLEIKDPKFALAHYVLRNNILRQKEKLEANEKPVSKTKNGHSCDKVLLKKFAPNVTEQTTKEILNDVSDISYEKLDYYDEEILDDDIVPRNVLSDLYGTYPKSVADKTLQLITRKHIIPLRGSMTNLAKKISLGDVDSDLDFNYYDWTESLRSQEEFYRTICAETLQEKKYSSQVRTYTTRLKSRRFPDTKSDQLSVAKFKSGKIISSPIIRKFQITGKAPKFYGRTPSYYTKAKILQNAKVDPTAKAKLRLQIDKSTDKNMGSYSEGFDTQTKTPDMAVKNYIGNLKRSRINKMERLEYVIEHEYSKGFQKGIGGSAKITIPYLNSNIIKERLQSNEETKDQYDPKQMKRGEKQV